MLSLPRTLTRLRNMLSADPGLLDEVLNVWGTEHLDEVAFLEMLDRNFLIENLNDLKNFIGPERLFAGLYLLGFLRDEPFRNRIDPGFWNRRITRESVELLVPVWGFLRDAMSRSPEIGRQLAEMSSPGGEATASPPFREYAALPAGPAHVQKAPATKPDGRIRDLEREKSQLQEQVARYRRENDELRKKLDDSQQEFEARVDEALSALLHEWFQRYRATAESTVVEAQERLDAVLKRTERALELQKQADEKYGLAAAVRRALLRTELYLSEIECVYTDSLFVHGEIEKAKEALLREKKRILALPGIDRILNRTPGALTETDLIRKIHLMEPVASNLTKINSVQAIVNGLAALGFIEDPERLAEDISRKKRQILEALYASFPPAGRITSHDRSYKNLDDFIEAGAARKYDVYVDGYNILLNLRGGTGKASDTPLSAVRDDFIGAVCRKSRLFRKIYLVFDGVEESREVRGNAEIVYADRKRGSSADTVIINALKRSGDKGALLVTADQEIITATEKWVYAVIAPAHFHMFVNDIQWPETHGPLPVRT